MKFFFYSAAVSEFVFFTKNPNLKKTTLLVFFGRGWGVGVSEFFYKESYLKKTPFLKLCVCGGGGGGGGEGRGLE